MDRTAFPTAVRRIVSRHGILLVAALGLSVFAAERYGMPAPAAARQASAVPGVPMTADRQRDRPEMLPTGVAETARPIGFETNTATLAHAGQVSARQVGAIDVNVEAGRQRSELFGLPRPPSFQPVPVEPPSVAIEPKPPSPSEPWPRVEATPNQPWTSADKAPSEPWPRAEALETDEPLSVSEEERVETSVPSGNSDPPQPLPALADPSPEESASLRQQPPYHSAAMHAVRLRAGGLVREGFALGGRGMYYSARSKFIQALRTISQALDAQAGTQKHTQALAAGLGALEEVDDFMPAGARLEADVDLNGLISAHRTPVLKDVDPERITPLFAQQSYYTFAQRQLALAAGHEPAGSMALYGLARLETTLAKGDPREHRTAGPKAMSMYQAALLVQRNNYMAANELGVLLTRYGQYEQARRQFEHSVRLTPQGTTWHNLAVVHHMLGQEELAASARRQADLLARRAERAAGKAANQHSSVLWLTPESFARAGGASGAAKARAARTAPASSSPAKKQQTTDSPAKSNLFGWLPWKKSPR